MGNLLGQRTPKAESNLGMIEPERLVRDGGGGSTTYRERKEDTIRITDTTEPVYDPDPVDESEPVVDEANPVKVPTPDLPGHGLPDVDDRVLEITVEPDDTTDNAESESNTNTDTGTSTSNETTMVEATGQGILKKWENDIKPALAKVDNKVWYGLGGGVALITIIAIAK
jgi:hypothetical protein